MGGIWGLGLRAHRVGVLSYYDMHHDFSVAVGSIVLSRVWVSWRRDRRADVLCSFPSI